MKNSAVARIALVPDAAGATAIIAVIADAAEVPASAPSQASLRLAFARDGGTTRLVQRAHFGPLRVQKALYPEGAALCHAVIVHPPGGVVGGDRLQIAVDTGAAAQALLTTPGAAKWYCANGRVSQQSVHLTAGAGATLEWLPQESIFYNRAAVRLQHQVCLAADAGYIGIDILCFGRTAAGETFDRGSLGQRLMIRRGGRLLWCEQGTIEAGSRAMHGALGLGGATVCATMVAVGDGLTASMVQDLRSSVASTDIGADAGFGVSLQKSVLVARYLGNSSATARHLMTSAWAQVRPVLVGRDAVTPRLWNT
jgi:urease accessory protein